MARKKKKGEEKVKDTRRRIHHRRRLPIIGAADRHRRPSKPSPEDPLIISASELRDFLRCRTRWYWRYIARLQPLKKAVPLTMGSIGHDILGHWYQIPQFKKRTVSAMEQIADKILAETDPEEMTLDDIELLRAMCVGYAAWARPRDRELKLSKPQSELFFNEPLTEDGTIRVIGYIDLVFEARYLNGTIGSLESKFKGQIRMGGIDQNIQLSLYLWALSRIYPDAKRYIAWYQVLRKQMPGPRVKADLFARESVERTVDEVKQWELDTQRAALDMLDAAIYPNPNDNCSWDCDYQTPCLLRGTQDLEGVLKTQFKTRD